MALAVQGRQQIVEDAGFPLRSRQIERDAPRRIAVTPLYCQVRVLPAWDLGTVEAYAVYANGNAIKLAARSSISSPTTFATLPLDLLFSQGPGSSHAKAARSHRDQDAAD